MSIAKLSVDPDYHDQSRSRVSGSPRRAESAMMRISRPSEARTDVVEHTRCGAASAQLDDAADQRDEAAHDPDSDAEGSRR
jgi:hypothetical protein